MHFFFIFFLLFFSYFNRDFKFFKQKNCPIYLKLFVLVKYYEDAIAKLKRSCDRSIRDADGKLLNIPYRLEFMCSENQRRLTSRYTYEPKTQRPGQDFIFEDVRLSQDEGKKIARARKDCFFSHNYHTKGCLFVLELLHQRCFVTHLCTSRHPVTKQRYPGLVTNTLMCKIMSCREHGICHLNGCCLNAHLCNK